MIDRKNRKLAAFFMLRAAAVFTALLTMSGCARRTPGASSSSDKKVLTYSRSQGPYTDLFEKGVAPILEKEGYTLKGYDYSDLGLADDALNGGDVDFNVEQHTAYAENYNKANNADLVPVTPIPTVPAGMYSSKHTSLSELKDGASVAVPNDPSNTARAYVLLQKAGWITLKTGVNLATVTQQDIASNPHQIKFTEMKSLNIPTVIDDFDYIVITGSIVYNAKIDPSTALITEDVLDHLVLQVVVKAKNKDAKWVKDIIAAYHSPEFKTYLDVHNNGLWWVPAGYFN